MQRSVEYSASFSYGQMTCVFEEDEDDGELGFDGDPGLEGLLGDEGDAGLEGEEGFEGDDGDEVIVSSSLSSSHKSHSVELYGNG